MPHDDRWDYPMFLILARGLDQLAEFAVHNGIHFEIQVDLTKGQQKERHVFQSHEDGCVVTPNPNHYGCHRPAEVIPLKGADDVA